MTQYAWDTWENEGEDEMQDNNQQHSKPYGKGKTICKPILTASDANKNIR